MFSYHLFWILAAENVDFLSKFEKFNIYFNHSSDRI